MSGAGPGPGRPAGAGLSPAEKPLPVRQEPSQPRGWWSGRIGLAAFLGLALLSEAAGACGLFAVPVLDVFVARRFGLSLAGMGIAVAATDFGMVLGLAVAGPLSDRIGPRALLAAGAAAAAGLASLLGAVSSFNALLGVLVLYGAALTAVPAAGMKAVFHAFEGRPRGLPMGIRQTGTPVGAALAALALPAWTPALGAGAVFRLVGLAVLVTGWAFAAAIPGSLRGGRRPGEATTRAPGGASALAGTPTPRRAAPAALVALRPVAWPLAVAFLMSAGQYDIAAFTLPDLGRRAGLAATAAGAVLGAAQVGGGAGRVALGLWSDRLGGDRARVIGQAALLGAGAAVAAAAALPRSTAALAALWFVFGLGALGWNSLATLWAAESVDPSRSGRALSTVAMVVMAGATVQPPLFGALADARGFPWGWSLVALDLALAGSLCWRARAVQRDPARRDSRPAPL